MDEERYRQFFTDLTSFPPHNYQVEVAKLLFAGRNVVLRAPTGAGKTWSVLGPFLSEEWNNRTTRLIYALPLRTLANGVYHQAQIAANHLRKNVEPRLDTKGREIAAPFVTLQTGEQPDDPFFARGTIVVTTYDQVLSGLLDGPYGLPSKLHNINAAAIAGTMIVFDEFHLMPSSKAFLTGIACLNLFRDVCQSVWMTATATSPLREVLCSALGTVEIPADGAGFDKMVANLDSVTTVSRTLKFESSPLSVQSIVDTHQKRSIVLLNTVDRAQIVFREVRAELIRRNRLTTPILLHSRFFQHHREQTEAKLRKTLGPNANADAILIATQVVEAGLDISCQHLHTELCPMNSLVQRAGRCARFRDEIGTVHVYQLAEDRRSWLPYGTPTAPDPLLTHTNELLERIRVAKVTPQAVAEWVETVHADADAIGIRDTWQKHQNRCIERIAKNAILRESSSVSDLIRGDDNDSIRIIIANQPPETPAKLDGINLDRRVLASKLRGCVGTGWYWASAEVPQWNPLLSASDLRKTYVVCLSTGFANYDPQVGLILGEAGTIESDERKPIPRPGHFCLKEEAWIDHACAVADEAERRLSHDFPSHSTAAAGLLQRYQIDYSALRDAVRLAALLHDLGKLQTRWVQWSEAAMRSRDPQYVLDAPLAHTVFDPDNPADLKAERELQRQGIRRPSHAPASAIYSWPIMGEFLQSVPQNYRRAVGGACLGAILSHHGGWIPPRDRLAIDSLTPNWEEALRGVLGNDIKLAQLPAVRNQIDLCGKFKSRMDSVASADTFAEWWPLMSLLTRILRLSDQRATAEAHLHD